MFAGDLSIPEPVVRFEQLLKFQRSRQGECQPAESWSVVGACVPLFLLLFGAWFRLARALKPGFSKPDCGRCLFSPKTGECSGSFDRARRVATTLYALLPLTFIGSFVLAIYVVASVLPYGDEVIAGRVPT